MITKTAIIIDVISMKELNCLNDYIKIDLYDFLSNEIDTDAIDDIDKFETDLIDDILKITNKKRLWELANCYSIYITEVVDYIRELKDDTDANNYNCKEIL